MKDITLVSIGAGNMGGSLLKGLIRSKSMLPSRLRAADKRKDLLDRLSKELKVKTFSNNRLAARKANVVLLAVKPQILSQVIKELKGHIEKDALIISVAAGFSTKAIENLLGGKPRLIRAMPNIAAMVGKAATGMCKGRYANQKDLRLASRLFETCGTVTRVDECLMDAVTGLSGTGPMYVFIIIEALSDAGVRVGLGREQATQLAIQTVLGAAHMVMETGQHPIFLKDLVTSPGGTAINALYSMEKTGLRAVLMDAVEVATTRSCELGKPFEDDQPPQD